MERVSSITAYLATRKTFPLRWGKGSTNEYTGEVIPPATRVVMGLKNPDRKPKRFRGGSENPHAAGWWNGVAAWSARRSQKHRRRDARRAGR